MKLSLSVITRKNHDKLYRLLKSVKSARFDEIQVVETGGGDVDVARVCLMMGAKYSTYVDPNQAEFEKFCEEKNFGKPDHFSDFAAARNHAFSLCSGDWICWLDSDDVLINPEELRPIVEQADRENKESVQIYYLYGKDPAGHVVSEQWRERVVRAGSGSWKPFLHEVYINPKRQLDAKIIEDRALIRVEHSSKTLEEASDLRNARLLMYQLWKTGELESRMWKMLGKSCRGLGKYLDAIYAYEQHTKTSSWDLDHYFSWYEMAHCYRMMNMPDAASECDRKALWIKPQYPQAWAGLAASALQLRQFEKALNFSEMGIAQMIARGQETSLVEFNPAGTKRVLYWTQYRALFEMGRHEDSLIPLQTLTKLFPNIQDYKEAQRVTLECMASAKTAQALGSIIEKAREARDEKKFYSALDSAPDDSKELAPFQFLKRLTPDRGKHSVAIVCHNKTIRFGPSSLKQGVGGSEEAVIHMADALAREGLWVDVFADTLEEGVHGEGENKYRWYQTSAYRRNQVYDTVISWRNPSLFASGRVAAKNCVVWLHDVGREDEWPKSCLRNIDKVIVLSEYHRGTVPWVPEDKILYSRNGIHLDWLAEPHNDPKKVIYASNPTRGLKNLLNVWPDVHKATGAELHLFYGFTEWHRRLVADNPQEQKYIVEIKNLFERMAPYKVFDHGMVGQKELAEWTAKCGVAAYPTTFPEVSCISMMRNQACGAVPVCTDYAALSETVICGSKIPWKESEEYPLGIFRDKLIYLINNEGLQGKIRSEMIPLVRSKFTWQEVASQWKEIFSTTHPLDLSLYPELQEGKTSSETSLEAS